METIVFFVFLGVLMSTLLVFFVRSVWVYFLVAVANIGMSIVLKTIVPSLPNHIFGMITAFNLIFGLSIVRSVHRAGWGAMNRKRSPSRTDFAPAQPAPVSAKSESTGDHSAPVLLPSEGYFFLVGAKSVGPFSGIQLSGLHGAGLIHDNTLTWRDAAEGWVELKHRMNSLKQPPPYSAAWVSSATSPQKSQVRQENSMRLPMAPRKTKT